VRDWFAYGGGTIFQFRARKGTHGIYLDDLINFPKPELEILFYSLPAPTHAEHLSSLHAAWKCGGDGSLSGHDSE
jgi:hypothetical protein